MFYDLYEILCKKKGVAPTRAAIDIGLSKSTPTTWKKRGLTPQGETLQKIADYFGVTTDYLLTGEETKKPAATEDDELNEYLEYLKNREDGRMLFSLAKNATKEDVMRMVAIIEALRKEEGR